MLGVVVARRRELLFRLRALELSVNVDVNTRAFLAFSV